MIGEKNIYVAVGTRFDNRKDGYITVRVSAFDGTGTTGETQIIPGSGSLRVVKADGFKLTIVSDSGETFEFDVETEQLLSSAR